MSGEAFFAMIGVLVLTPPSLLLFAPWRLVDPDDSDARWRLNFARTLAWICCCMPILRMALSFAPERSFGNVGVYLNLLFPILAVVMGSAAMIFLLLNQNGFGRVLSLLACFLSVGLSLLGLWAGLAVA